MEIGDYYDSLRINKNVIVNRVEENGYKDQYFHSEDVKWVVFDIKENGDILLISEKPINQKIYLSGKTGYDNSVKILNKLCEQITGITRARNLTQEDIINSKYWLNNTKNNLIFGNGDSKEDIYEYWLASPCVLATSTIAYFGMRYVDSSGCVDYYDLYDSKDHAYGASHTIRPMVVLDKEKMVKKGE